MKQAAPEHSGSTGCQKKVILLDEYVKTTEALLDSITVLSARIGKSDKAEYDRLREATEGSRMRSELARVALDSYVTSHKC
jgi:hypothetical protein